MNALNITHQALTALVAPVLPHVDASGGLPILECVNFETVGGYVTATATDRYTIAICRHKVEDGTDFHAKINARELKALLTMFRPQRHVLGDLELTVTDHGTIRVEGPGALFSSAVIEYATCDADFPKIKGIFNRAETDQTTHGKVALSPILLAKFALAARPHEPIQINMGNEHRPVFITSGDHFTGAIMPVRFKRDEVPDWSTILPPTVKGELAQVSA